MGQLFKLPAGFQPAVRPIGNRPAGYNPAPLRRRALPVENDLDRLRQAGVAVLARDLLQEHEKIRHDPAAIAEIALELAAEGRARRVSHSMLAGVPE